MYVYLVDDDPLVLASLEATLAGRYETRTFQTAEALLAVADDLAPGVALIDMALPGMDGASLHTKLCGRQTPVEVVFLTGQASVPLAVDAYAVARSTSSASRFAALTCSPPSIVPLND